MALAFVQKASAATFTATTLTVTISSTQNNLLIGTMFTRASAATNPTGYVTDVEIVNATEDDRLRITSKIAGASESNPQWTGLTASDGSGTCAGVLEFSGNATASVLDKTNSTGRTVTATSIQTGSSGVLTQANEVAIGAVGHRIAIGSPAWDSSFNLGNSLNDGASAVCGLVDGYLIVSATTALNPSHSWATADTVVAAIATYKASAAAGTGHGLFIPPLLNGLGSGGPFFNNQIG